MSYNQSSLVARSERNFKNINPLVTIRAILHDFKNHKKNTLNMKD